jgi:hypothetical protein
MVPLRAITDDEGRATRPGPAREDVNGGDRFRRGPVKPRLHHEVSLPSLIRENLLAANTQLALAA